MTDLNPVDAMTTNPYRAMCAELLCAMDEIAEYEVVDWAWVKTQPLKMASQSMAEARALLDQPEPQPVPVSEGLPGPENCDGEVAAALIELRSTVMGLDQMKMYVAAQRVGRAADLLERLASDNAGLEAAADSLWADNVSLLDN